MDVSDDRGQALQVGAILLFGILIVGLSLYQATVVPTQNERVEFDTYVDANADVEQLSTGISAAAARDYSTRTAVQTGVRYPTRTIFVNPGAPGNRLRTGESQTIRISNAAAVNGEEANTGEYWNGTTREYDTTSVRFDPDYNQLQAPRIIYESGTIYRPTGQTADAPYGPNESIVVSDGTSIEGNRITLVTIAGDLDVGGMSPTVVAQPVSAHTRTVVIEGDGSEDITLTVPSQLSADTWEEEIVGDNQHVLDVSQHDDTSVNVTLDGSEAYELRLAKVELRRQSDSSSVASTDPKYVIGVAGDGQSISQDQSTKLTAEVRDQYNNPVPGEQVEFDIVSGGGGNNQLSATTATTNDQGRASVQFEPDSTDTFEIEASVDGGASETLNTITFTVSVGQGGGGGDGSGTDQLNPNSSDSVYLETAEVTNNDAVVTLRNNGNSERTIEQLRVQFYYTDRQSKSTNRITQVDAIESDNSEITSETPRTIPTGFMDVTSNNDINGTDTRSLTFDFDEDVNAGQQETDFFYFSVQFENGDVSTYLVAPE